MGIGDLDPNNRDRALSLRWETRHHWPALKSEFGVCETGAAITLALVTEYRGAGRPISYSRHQAHYEVPGRYRSRLYTYRKVVGTANHLGAAGLIFDNRVAPGSRGRQSTMLPTPELIERAGLILDACLPLVIARPTEVIILRGADGELIDYKDAAEKKRMRHSAEQINEAIREAEISGTLAAPMVRIFNKSFDRGGRFYAMGGGWQSMKKEARKLVQIGGEQVVEVDYKTLHPAILYAEIGASLPADCYEIADWPRPLVKVALLILINARTPASARFALANHENMIAVAPVGSQEAIRTAARLISDIKRVHVPIAGAFHSDAGARLMRLDSELAETVMHMMLRQGILVLPVHDSFLVPASKVKILEEAMVKAAHEAGISAIRVA